MLLAGKTCLVSGVGPGLGKELALAFARQGADVALGARSEASLLDVGAEIEALGRRWTHAVTDITDADHCARLVDTCVDTLGRVDVLIHNAVMYDPRQPFADADLDDWRRVIDTNVFGTLQLTHAALPAMKEQHQGSIVFVSSMIVRKPVVRQGAYAASKGALFAGAQALAKELGPFGIRVNTIVPGMIWGPLVQHHFEERARHGGATVDEQYDEAASRVPLRVIPSAKDCADAAVFFASDLSAVVTGQSLDVNGGDFVH